MEERESGRPLRIGGGEEHGHVAPVVRCQDHRLGSLGGLEHGAEVLHARLQRRELPVAVGYAGAALVEQNQPERLGKPIVEGAPVRRLPPVHEVGGEVGHEHQVSLALADDLVRDRGTFAPGIADVGIHGVSLPRLASWPQP